MLPGRMVHFNLSVVISWQLFDPLRCSFWLFGVFCFSQSTALALPCFLFLLTPPHALFLALSLVHFLSMKVQTQSQAVTNSGVSWWKPRGNVLGIAFILLKTRLLFFCFQHDQAQLFAQFSADSLTNGFSSRVLSQPLASLQLCWDYMLSCN